MTQSTAAPIVSVPGDEDVEFSVSTSRIEAVLEELEIDVPEEIAYKQTVIVDNDPSLEPIEDVDGFDSIPYIDGRVRQVSEGIVGDEHEQRVLLTADVEINPERINARSGGQWITAWLGFPEDVDVSSIMHESVMFETIPAENDGQYGFVADPSTRVRKDTKYVKVKFPRDEIIEKFDPGEHEAVLTGLVDETPFQGRASIEVFEPGNRGNSGDQDGRGNSGNN